MDDPHRGKLHLCTDCWNAHNRSLAQSNLPVTVQCLLATSPQNVPKPDLQVALAHILGQNRAWVLAHPEATLSEEQSTVWKAAQERLRRGTPLAYVLGRWEFFGLEFTVTPDVLIPRPETELLVETALSGIRRPGKAIRNVLEVGTGSGCIAISLALNDPTISITATDISPKAIAIAHANAVKHGVASRIELLTADLFDCPTLTGRRFDLLVANLPYIPSWTLRTLEVFGREPTLALDGGPDGLNLIRRLLQAAPEHLTPAGRMLLEIEANQGSAAANLARQAFPKAEIKILTDLSGHDRLLVVQM